MPPDDDIMTPAGAGSMGADARLNMGITQRVRLHAGTGVPLDAREGPPAQPLLEAAGPFLVLGGRHAASMPPTPLRPAPDTLFGPRGVCLAAPEGPLCVCDTGHHRLLLWKQRPDADDAPCDLCIGQRDAFSEGGRNGGDVPHAASVNVPTGVATDGQALVVADAWNHRVLIWHAWPTRDNQPADVVLGQADMQSHLPNRGRERPGADTLNWCYGVALVDGRLVVADTGNRRLLVWESLPQRNGTAADLVLGQADMCSRHDVGTSLHDGAGGVRWPHAIAWHDGHLLVADAGNNRILGWRGWPQQDGAPAELVLGQADFGSLEHNRGAYLPTARSLNMPYGLASTHDWLLVADTANSRLLGWKPPLRNDAAAQALAGQPDFTSKGDNRWQLPQRDSLCWPYGLAASGDVVAVADSGNNRVLLWRLAA